MTKKVFLLPQLRAELEFSHEDKHESTSIVLAGGRAPDNNWLLSLVKNFKDSKLYCADKGVDYCLGNNLSMELVLGDGDSAHEGSFSKAEQLGARVIAYPTEKDDTDLQLVLKNIPKGDIVVSGIWGGRFDHLYSNVFSLVALQDNAAGLIVMADEKEIMFLLKPGELINLEIFSSDNLEAISLLPLASKSKVTLQGVYWPLKDKELSMYHPYAISNKLAFDNRIVCSCTVGSLGLYFKFK